MNIVVISRTNFIIIKIRSKFEVRFVCLSEGILDGMRNTVKSEQELF